MAATHLRDLLQTERAFGLTPLKQTPHGRQTIHRDIALRLSTFRSPIYISEYVSNCVSEAGFLHS